MDDGLASVLRAGLDGRRSERWLDDCHWIHVVFWGLWECEGVRGSLDIILEVSGTDACDAGVCLVFVVHYDGLATSYQWAHPLNVRRLGFNEWVFSVYKRLLPKGPMSSEL